MKKINLFTALLFFAFAASAQTTSTFEDLTLPVDTYWTGSNLAGGFSDGHTYFENQYDTSFGGYWAGGFVYSNKTNDTTGGFYNEGSSITGSGFGGSAKYAVAYDEGIGNVRVIPNGIAAGKILEGVYVTNTSYTYYSMKNGDQFEHAFSHDSADFYLLHISGWKNNSFLQDTVNFYLANFVTDSPGYIVNTWQYVSLTSLGDVDSLVFWVTGSQNGSFGLNTPGYFAIDNFTTADIGFSYDTVKYNRDTLINVLSNFPDTLTGGPFTVHFVTNDIPGASVVIDSANLIFYVPQQGVVGNDTITYAICNSNNQCDTAQIIIDVESPTGITEINTLQAHVYPNPFSNSFSVYHSSEVKSVNLYDIEGRLIREIPCSTGELITGIDGTNLPAGMYLVKLISDNAVGIAKISKQ